MRSQHPFDDWADIYDRVYAYLTHDVPFYVQQSLASGGPVLELGCGTGRVSLAIAEAGFDVVGVDISPRMLAAARAKADEQGLAARCRFVHGDMRTVNLKRRFPLVIMPFRSFQSMLTVDDQRQALANAKAHLKHGGMLALDVFAPDIPMLAVDDSATFHVRDVPQRKTGHTFVVWGQNRWDHLAQTNAARLFIEELDQDATVMRRLHREFTVRYTFRYEMQYLLEACGFTVEVVYGGFDGGPVEENSADLVWVART